MRIFPFPFFVAAAIAATPVAASAGSVYISKISTAGAAAHEWIEIANDGTETVDLTGWKLWESQTNHGLKPVVGDMLLPSGSAAVVAEDAVTFIADHPDRSGQVLDSSWGSLSDDGEEIGLRDPAGVLVESFVYSATGGGTIARDSAMGLEWCPVPDEDVLSVDFMCSPPEEPVLDDAPDAIADDSAEETVVGQANGSTDGEMTNGNTMEDTAAEDVAVPANADQVLSLRLSEIFPAPTSGAKEWVEVWNDSAYPSGSDCEIHDATGRIAVVSGDIAPASYAKTEISSAKLNNDGDTVSLVCADALIDSIAYGTAQVPAPGSDQSLARESLPDGAWRVTTLATPGDTNSIAAPMTSPTAKASTQPSARKNATGRVLVNEIFPGPKGTAWIELANPESKSVLLSGWRLVVGTDDAVKIGGALRSDGHLVIRDLNGSVYPSGGIVFLVDAQGYTIDEVIWGQGDNTPADNAPSVTTVGYSIARKYDALSTDDEATDFIVTSSPTPGKENVISSLEARPHTTAPGKIRLNEILPDPSGPEAEGEFVEIRNTGDSSAALDGFRISVGVHAARTVGTGPLAPGELLKLDRKAIGYALPNSGGSLKLIDPDGITVDSITYDALGSGVALALSDGAWSETVTPTPGTANIIEEPNAPPKAKIASEAPDGDDGEYGFDAGDSYDDDGPLASLSWDFGDGATSDATSTTHAFEIAGRHEVRLTVTDSKGSSSTAKKVIRVPAKYAIATLESQPPVKKKAATKKTVSSSKKTSVLATEGIAMSDAGALGSRLVALMTSDGYKLIELPKTTDKVSLGDLVHAEGIAGSRNGLPLIKVHEFRTEAGTQPEPAGQDSIDAVDDLPTYSLVTVTGTVVEKRTANLLLSGDGEIKVVLPRTGKRGSYTVGEGLSVTGIVRRNSDGTTDLVTRSIDDLRITNEAPLPVTSTSKDEPISPIGAGAAGTASGILASAAWGASSGARKRFLETIASFRSLRAS